VKQPSKVVLSTAGSLAATILTLTGLSIAEAGIAMLGLMVCALCWTITDSGRSQRLAMLIDAIRGNNRQQTPQQERIARAADPNRGKAA
jgi:hypothetical protein